MTYIEAKRSRRLSRASIGDITQEARLGIAAFLGMVLVDVASLAANQSRRLGKGWENGLGEGWENGMGEGWEKVGRRLGEWLGERWEKVGRMGWEKVGRRTENSGQ